ncbi:MAG: sigma 54-interacting transcriptional regulator, partial [Myxococcales bacterium]|nr:sigma 54-interacting transcriptional regulator [Myxococcales bacterium]
WLVLGRIYLRRNSQRALPALARSRLVAARVDETIALLRLGRFAEAERAASAALGGEIDVETRADLVVSRALARSFAGDLAGPAADLADLAEPPSPRRRFRLHNARATIALRAGRLDEAVRSYTRALGETRRSALDDLELSATVNLAVARHQAGDHGRALSGYARARDLARAAGSDRTCVLVALYRARLFADLEAWDRAELELSFAPPDALGPIERASRTHVLGEIALARGRPDDAESLGRAAADACAGAPRERAEALTLVLAARVARGDAAGARSLAEELRDDAIALGADDVLARVELAWSERAAATGATDEALAAARDALAAAERAKRPRLARSAHALLGRVLLATGASLAASPHVEAARRLEEELRAALPADLRGPSPASPPPSPQAAQAATELPRRLLRVFAATSETDAYARIVDEAIAETGAERGFLLRRGAGDELHVAAAKNVDHGAIKRPRQKYGRSIAARVIETGEVVALADARAVDSRPTATAHRLGLRSVLCVPVFAEGRVEGALYLDNRFTAGAFSPDDERTVRILLEGLGSVVARHRAEARLARELASRAAAAPAAPVDLGRVVAAVSSPFPEIATRSHAMAAALETARRVADVDVPVLVRGESGTGKELVARAIHEHGARRGGPFVAVNCGALPEPLLEAELFGYVRGAFTGAAHDKPGLFVAARGGTLFLDEIGEMPLAMQVKLLRVLQEREVRPLGSTRVIPVDARIVSATHRDLRAQIDGGQFREDLYYRVAVVDLTLPPLRERIDDVPALAELFVERLRQRSGSDRRLSPAAMGQLVRHGWPGNVRELESALARAFYLGDGPEILEVPGLASPGRARRKDEREVLAAALAREGWNVRKVAQMLGIPRATFYRRLARYGLERAPR